MWRSLLAVALCAAPAVAREVRGRVVQTQDEGESIRAEVVTDSGELVTLSAQDKVTKVYEKGRPSAPAALRALPRLRAKVDDGCKLESGACTASSMDLEPMARVVRFEAMRERGPREEPPPAAEPPAAAPAEVHEAVRRSFMRGELTNLLGSDRLVVADSRFGLRVGYARLDNASYLSVSPELDLHFGDDVALGLGVPLHVRAYADGFYDTHQIKFRQHDYDRPSDYARVLRFLTVGRKEEPFYLNVSQLFAASIGHGALVRRYSGNIDTNVTRVGAQLAAYGRYGGFEAFTGDIVQPQHVLAGRAFAKPLGWLTGPEGDTLGWTSLGVSTAMDLAAPYTLERGPNGYPSVGDSDVCPQPGVASCDPGEPIVRETRRAQVVGLDLETKVVNTEGAELKPYLDYSRLLAIANPTGPGAHASGGGGLSAGMVGRFQSAGEAPHAFRFVIEGRYFDGNYLPGYFDTFYEVQKYQYITGKADTAYEPKLRTVLGRDGTHKRAGYSVEAAYQYNNGLALMAAFEDSIHVAGPASICYGCTGTQAAVGSRNLTLHIEYPAYSWLQFFGSFYRRSFDGVALDTARPLGDNTLVYAAARIHTLWIFFLNARVYRSWQADPVLGEMRNLWGGDFDLEVGYEFDRGSHR